MNLKCAHRCSRTDRFGPIFKRQGNFLIELSFYVQGNFLIVLGFYVAQYAVTKTGTQGRIAPNQYVKILDMPIYVN